MPVFVRSYEIIGGFGAAVGLPSTPGRKLLRMQSVGLPPWRGRRRPEKAKCLAFSAEGNWLFRIYNPKLASDAPGADEYWMYDD